MCKHDERLTKLHKDLIGKLSGTKPKEVKIDSLRRFIRRETKNPAS